MPQGWLDRVQDLLLSGEGPTFVEADEAFGLPYVLADLAQKKRIVWVRLQKGDAPDRVATGNRLAEALNRHLGNPLYPLGYPLRAVLAALEAEGTPRVWLAVSGAEQNPALALELAQSWGRERTLLAGTNPSPPRFRVVKESDLALTWEEARQEARRLGEPPEERVRAFWEATRGAYERFRQGLHEALGYPPLLRPYPEGPEPPPELARSMDVRRVLSLLLRQERWGEAFALAAKHDPETALSIVEKASEALLARGEYDTLAALTERLLESYPHHASLLRAWYEAQVGLGKAIPASRRVIAFLEKHPDPDLEALLTIAIGHGEQSDWEWTEHAPWERATTPYTLLAQGVVEWRRSTPENTRFASSAARAAMLAAEQGQGRLAVVAAGRASGILLSLGRYREALFWAEWALQVADSHGIQGANERLSVLDSWVYAQGVLGKTEGLTLILEQALSFLKAAAPKQRRLFMETLAYVHLAKGEPEKAVATFEELFEAYPDPLLRVRYGGGYALALWAAGEDKKALEEGERAAMLSWGLDRGNELFSLTTFMPLLSEQDPKRALALFKELLPRIERPGFDATYWVRAWLSAAAAHRRLGQDEAAARALEKARLHLENVAVPAGLAFLVGKPAAFLDLLGKAAPGKRLELRLLGPLPQVRFRGEALSLSLRSLEILVALVLRGPRRGEQLMLDVYGDEGNLNRLKVAVAKLREQVPVRSRPYALEIPVWADFVEVERLLSGGRFREAVALYRGPLLPDSTAPVVEEHRAALEELLRQAAMARAHDPAALEVAERMGDDLELWERIAEAASPEDPRTAVTVARVRQLREAWGV